MRVNSLLFGGRLTCWTEPGILSFGDTVVKISFWVAAPLLTLGVLGGVERRRERY